MNIFLVLAHPEEKSFNAAMHEQAKTTLEQMGHNVTESKLFQMGFDPISDRRNYTQLKDPDFFSQQNEELHASEHGLFSAAIEGEMQKLESADLVIWQFPLYWFSTPSILKGWAEKVFAYGRMYGSGMTYANGKFKGKKAMISITTGGPEKSYTPEGFNGNLLNALMPIHRGIFTFLGYDVLQPNVVYQPARISQEERREGLAKYDKRLQQIFTEKAIPIGKF